MKKLSWLRALAIFAALSFVSGAAWAQKAPFDENYQLGIREAAGPASGSSGAEWALALAYGLAMLAVVAYVARLVRAYRRLEADIEELKQQVCGSNDKRQDAKEDPGGGRVSGKG